MILKGYKVNRHIQILSNIILTTFSFIWAISAVCSAITDSTWIYAASILTRKFKWCTCLWSWNKNIHPFKNTTITIMWKVQSSPKRWTNMRPVTHTNGNTARHISYNGINQCKSLPHWTLQPQLLKVGSKDHHMLAIQTITRSRLILITSLKTKLFTATTISSSKLIYISWSHDEHYQKMNFSASKAHSSQLCVQVVLHSQIYRILHTQRSYLSHSHQCEDHKSNTITLNFQYRPKSSLYTSVEQFWNSNVQRGTTWFYINNT